MFLAGAESRTPDPGFIFAPGMFRVQGILGQLAVFIKHGPIHAD